GQALRVDLLCPGDSADAPPQFVARLGAAAQPLPFLEYLLETPEHAVTVAGEASLVKVPAPARFAFHKLLIAPLRAAAFATKADKDLVQAADIIEVLLEDRPGDLPLAWSALIDRGPRWQKAAERGLQGLRRRRAALHTRLRAAIT
ncbi:MAG TPA: GSU2403 family nucleotidyltransferase fold protein, partial [Polyangia bacterium]